jgi:chemotaxis response regulator CheB
MSVLAPPKKILTVEDNAIVSADVRSILEAAGYDVCPDARDGVEALEHVRAYAPDFVARR